MKSMLHFLQSIIGFFKSNSLENASAKALSTIKFDIGFDTFKQNLLRVLKSFNKKSKIPPIFILHGPAGCGKTIVARDTISTFLFSLGKIKTMNFTKIDVPKSMAEGLIHHVYPYKDGVILFHGIELLNEADTIKLKESLYIILEDNAFKKTAFIFSVSEN